MSTQQDIYAAGFENRPPMLNKDNYVSWSSLIIQYARSRPNGKMIVDFIENGPYVRRMIATPGEPDLPVLVPETFHEQIDEELTENDIKRMDADNQAIQTILLGLLEDVYATVDSCEIAKEIWKHYLLATIISNNNMYNPQPSLNQNFMQPPMTSLEDINDPTEIAQPGMNMSQDRQIQNIGGNGGNQFGQYVGQVAQNQQGYNAWQNGIANQNGTGNIIVARAEGTRNGNQSRCNNCRGLGHIARNCIAIPRRRDATYFQTQLLIAQMEEAGIKLQAEEFDLMAAAGDPDEIEEVNANCILMENLQHASTSGTQLDKAPVYDTDGSTEVQLNDTCYDNDIFNMFTHEVQYTYLLEPIPKPQQVPQNDNHVTSIASSMVQSEDTVETSSAPNEKTRTHQEIVYRNLIDQVVQVNMVNCNIRETNAELKSKLARYEIQEQRIEISQEKYDKLEKCYQKSVLSRTVSYQKNKCFTSKFC
nr:hypothetical protein [Tanacetum cinerariifolium]